MRPIPLVIMLCGLPLPAMAQSLIVPPGPVAPGSTINVTVVGAPATPVCLNGTSLFLLTSSGDLVTPRFRQAGGSLWFCSTGPASAMTLTFQVPAAGAGSSGSFVAYVPHAPGLAARLDVGAPAPGFPDLHTFPAVVEFGFGSHAAFAFNSPGWCFVNTSVAPHAFVPGDLLQIFTPGGTTPVATLPLPGLTVPAGGRVTFALPLAGLVPGPFTVQTAWADPAAGPITRRIGIHGGVVPTADLHLPGGHTVPAGGSIEAVMQFSDFSPGVPTYALLVGFLPGSTPLAPGAVVPLVPDALVLSSLSGALAPFLVNSPGTPSVSPGPYCSGYCGPGFLGLYETRGIFLFHPGPALSGAVLRLAGIAQNPLTGGWVATQPEEIVLL